MADTYFQMAQRNAANTGWDNLYPQDKFETAGGTSTAITLTIPELTDGCGKTFIASASNNSAPTTINGKSLYKPNTTTTPNLVAGKAYTVWYNAANGCFFIKASAEGDAAAENVLAEKKFSNDNDIGISGTMPNNGAINITQTSSGEVTNIPAGYTSGGKVTNNITIESLGGKKWGSGTVPKANAARNTNNNWYIPIPCNFKPSCIIITYTFWSYTYSTVYPQAAIYCANALNNPAWDSPNFNFLVAGGNNDSEYSYGDRSTNGLYITSGVSLMPLRMDSQANDRLNSDVNWFAYE